MADDTPNKTPRLSAIKADLEARAAPLKVERAAVREELDALTQNPRVAELRTRLKAINAELGPIDNELAALARVNPGNRAIAAEPGVFSKGE